MSSMVRTEQSGRVLVATLSRPPVNALNDRLIAELDGVVDRAIEDDDIAVLHLRSDQRVFSAGADLARGEDERRDGRVDDDEVVAEPVHLRERERRHGFAPDVSPRRTNGKRVPSPSVTSPAIS